MNDFTEMVLIPSIFIVLTVFGISALYGSYQCNNFEKITGKSTKYALLDACYIKTENGYQRYDEYKIKHAAIEGLR